VTVTDRALVVDAGDAYLDADVGKDGSDYVVFNYSDEMTPGSGCKEAAPDPLAPVMGSDGAQFTCTGDIASLRVLGGPTS
jgi:hypothetical protein